MILALNNYNEVYFRFLNIPAGDLRISITNACNMTCEYCHNEGQSGPGAKYLSIDKIRYIVQNAKKYGLTKVRITGGDPLVHPNIYDICYMIKNELGISNLGINTNGFERDILIQLCQSSLLRQVVIGMDYFDNAVSKKSPIGPSSAEIKELVLSLKQMGVNVQIAVVYSDNEEDICKLIAWGLDNHILIKVLEEENYYNLAFNPKRFESLLQLIKQKFNLSLGLTADLHEAYLYDYRGKILFFQSHCNRNECNLCRNMHLRINAEGKAKICLFRDDSYDLIAEDFDLNMKKAITYMGTPPNQEIL